MPLGLLFDFDFVFIELFLDDFVVFCLFNVFLSSSQHRSIPLGLPIGGKLVGSTANALEVKDCASRKKGMSSDLVIIDLLVFMKISMFLLIIILNNGMRLHTITFFRGITATKLSFLFIPVLRAVYNLNH